MIQTLTLSVGVTLRCCPDARFKQGRLSIQFIQPMARETAAMNALLPAVLLRGTARHPDLQAITNRLDDLYGASVGDVVRRVGDYQGVGLTCVFTDDRFALPGDAIFAPVVDLLREILLEPLTENGIFTEKILESEKKSRILDIESEYNDKRLYAANSMMKAMCTADSFGLPRLGTVEEVAAITGEKLWRQYQALLRGSPVEIFYVGAARPEAVAAQLRPLFAGITREVEPLPPQTPFCDGGKQQQTQVVRGAQSQLCLGFTTPITNQNPRFAAMQMCNVILGSGMTSKLFLNVRERLSLCYSIGSQYYGTKGILTVAAGIDGEKEVQTKAEILAQLDACRRGEITQEELAAAREALLSSLRSITDSPGSIEGYFGTQVLSGFRLSVAEYRAAVEAVTAEDVAAAAATVEEHTGFFLKGVAQC